jgi:hypothetical protein
MHFAQLQKPAAFYSIKRQNAPAEDLALMNGFQCSRSRDLLGMHGDFRIA